MGSFSNVGWGGSSVRKCVCALGLCFLSKNNTAYAAGGNEVYETFIIPGETLIPGGKRFTLVLDMPHI